MSRTVPIGLLSAALGFLVIPGSDLWAAVEWNETELQERLLGEDQDASRAALDAVLENSKKGQSVTLLMAAGAALKARRVADAGFLFNAGILRKQTDAAIFEPAGEGGDNPLLAIAVLQMQLGATINVAIVRDREAYGQIVERLKEWKPSYEDYEPFYEVKRVVEDPQERAEIISKRRDEMLKVMGGLNRLLQNDDYYEALLTNHASVFGFPRDLDITTISSRKDFERVEVPQEDIDAAIERGEEIERKMGIRGPFLETKSDREAAKKALQDAEQSVNEALQKLEDKE